MNPGKLSNSMLNRSVFKNIRCKNKAVWSKPCIGSDCAIIDTDGCNRIISAVSSGVNPVYRVANNIAACGGKPIAAQCSITLPAKMDEKRLKTIVIELDEACADNGMMISGGHTQVSESVSEPQIVVTGIGQSITDRVISSKNVKANQDIIMTKWIGIGGIRAVIDKQYDEIRKIYTEDVIEKAYGNVKDISVQPEARAAALNGVSAMHDVAEGGIYAALWDMAEAGRVGFEIDFRKIPVKQEIIEVCELLEINPYKLESSGCLLMTSDNGCDIINMLSEMGIKAVILGRTTSEKARIIHNNEEDRYLDTPKRDEIYRYI